MKYRVVHNTTYHYTGGAESCHNLVRLQARNLSHQRCREMTLSVSPQPLSVFEYSDYFGNLAHSFAIYEPHEKLSITAESLVEIDEQVASSPPETLAWNVVRQQLREDRSPEIVGVLEFVFDSPYIRAARNLRDLAAPHFLAGRPLAEATLALTAAIRREFKYDPKATTIDTSLDVVLQKRRGVCQDFAHLQIGCLRSLGLACRYVSGYLRTDTAPGKPRLVGADASHAWISVFCPGSGWLDFDPTNGCPTNDRHITIGWGRDFHDVSPVKGVVVGGGQSQLSVAVDVVPL